MVGVILNLAVWFALHTIFRATTAWQWGPLTLDRPDWTSLEPGAAILAIAALIAMLRFKIGMGWTLAASGVIGAAYYLGRYG